MTHDLTLYMGEQIFFDKCPCLCVDNDAWTAKQQARKEGKAGKLHKVIEKRYPNIKGSFFK